MSDKHSSKQTERDTDSRADIVATAVKLAGRREVPPDRDRDRIFNAAAAALKQQLSARRRRRWIGTAVAASILLAAVVGIGLQKPGSDHALRASADRVLGPVAWKAGASGVWQPIVEGDTLAENSWLRTDDTGRAGILTTNGTSVRLAADTTVELLAANILRLHEGKVYVDAGDDPRTSIEIDTAVGIARDIGTQFELRYVANDYRLRIREGEVSLATDTEQLLAQAGEELTVDSAGTAQVQPFDSSTHDWQWSEELAPVPDLDGQPVSMLLEWVSRETGRPIRYASNEIQIQASVTLLHGTVRKMSPLEILGAMLSTTDLRYLLQEDGTILIDAEG